MINVYFQPRFGKRFDRGAREVVLNQEAFEAYWEGIVDIVGVMEYEGYIAVHMPLTKESLADKCGKNSGKLIHSPFFVTAVTENKKFAK